MCFGCNVERGVCYRPPLGNVSVNMNLEVRPFALVSIDQLGSVSCHPMKGSRNTVKLYPLMMVCISTDASQVYQSAVRSVIMGLVGLMNISCYVYLLSFYINQSTIGPLTGWFLQFA